MQDIETLRKLVNKINIDPDNLYKNLTKTFEKEYVDMVMYEEICYVNNNVKDKRSEQTKFRNDLVNKYKNCVITGNGELLCDACHIVPYYVSNDNNIYNGLLMDTSIHRLFDLYLISIDPNTMRVSISDKLDKSMYGNVWRYNNAKINIDRRSTQYLKIHYNIFIS
jgi:hypothetical protein